MIYTVTLNPSLDYIAFTDTICEGKTNRTKDEYIVPGGKGLNISILLSRLCCPSTALGFIGGFTGKELQNLLKAESINCNFTEVADTTRINFKLNSGKITEFNGSGITLDTDKIEKLKTRIKNLKSGDWLCLSGSIPKGAKADIYKELALSAPDSVITVIDAVGEPLKQALLAKPFLIKPNRDELCDFFGVDKIADEDIEIYAKKLQNMGAQNVMISLGSAGAFLLNSNGKTYFQKAPEGNPINTVAAGDSMIAGFIKRYCETNDFADSLKFAVAAGSATAFSKWLAEKDLIYKLYNS
ncbi:MAG: 1-phosphofructokinase [Clostridia bacterium]|nr:1-phosphofructokinase [Clostridia bacterium]